MKHRMPDEIVTSFYEENKDHIMLTVHIWALEWLYDRMIDEQLALELAEIKSEETE